MKDLKDLRKEITEIDNKMADLFVSRMKLVHQIAEYKMENGLPVLDPGRQRCWKTERQESKTARCVHIT